MADGTSAASAPGESVAQRNWHSVRTVIEALSLAGIMWLASSVQSQNESIIKLQVQVQAVQATLFNVPGLDVRTTRLETNQLEILRRLGRIEDGSDKAKGWTK